MVCYKLMTSVLAQTEINFDSMLRDFESLGILLDQEQAAKRNRISLSQMR
jgi:hypothetical protein